MLVRSSNVRGLGQRSLAIQCRYNSSSDSAKSLALPALSSRLNAPTTLPPPLILPESRKAEEYRIKYYYRVGKSYLTFYKTGFKQVLNNRKTAKLIRAAHLDSPLVRAIPGSTIDHTTGQVLQPAASSSAESRESLSRAEYQFLRRHARDIKKVPIFAVLLAIFGEWLPLFVIFLDPLIPGTVLLPVQVARRRKKQGLSTQDTSEDKRIARITPHGIKGDLEGAGIHDKQQLVRIAQRFGLIGFVSRYYPANRILARIQLHEQYLATDDSLLLQDLTSDPNLAETSTSKTSEKVGGESLDDNELDLAVEERGMWLDSQSQGERRSLLHRWLHYRKE